MLEQKEKKSSWLIYEAVSILERLGHIFLIPQNALHVHSHVNVPPRRARCTES